MRVICSPTWVDPVKLILRTRGSTQSALPSSEPPRVATGLRRIVLAMYGQAVATVAVVVFIGIWNEFFFANLFTASLGNQNVQLALASFRSQFGFNVSGTLASATLIMLVPILAFLILQRQVVSGLTAGAAR